MSRGKEMRRTQEVERNGESGAREWRQRALWAKVGASEAGPLIGRSHGRTGSGVGVGKDCTIELYALGG